MLRIVAALCCYMAVVQCESAGEPMCLSRFDYDYKVLSKLVELDNRLKQMWESSEMERRELRQKSEEQQRQIERLSANLDAAIMEQRKSQKDDGGDLNKSRKPGNIYVRWGKTSCPSNGTQLVYSGYVGGSHYSHRGAAVDYICLPKDPQWSKYKDGVEQISGYVYGAEYELDQRDLNSMFGSNIHDDDVPCAVCHTERSSVLMIPGRNQCYSGWTLEYHGYLTSGYYKHNAASQYVCLEGEPEIIPDTRRNDNGVLFYFVEARCGSLPCPPYVEGRELTCVVCTR